MLLAGGAPTALAASKVRFVNGVPGAGPVDVSAGSRQVVGSLAFGRASGYVSVPSRPVRIAVGDRRDPVVTGTQRFRDGRRYTVIATANGDTELVTVQDGASAAGRARLRLVQAADELGDPDVFVGRRRVASGFAYRDIVSYRSFEPGSYRIEARRQGGGGDPLVAADGVNLSAGTASTAILLGTSGERAQILILPDGAFTPVGAPATGLGGLAGGLSPWLVVLLAALSGGLLAGGAYRAAAGGRSRRAPGG